MWKSANLAFSLCQMLTMGAVEALAHHASDELKQRFLPKMVAGEWTGTMNLTEPQAGSDLSAVRTRAEPDGDHYRSVRLQDLHHLGRARRCREHCPSRARAHCRMRLRARAASRCSWRRNSWSIPTAASGARNDLVCASIEHKLGIHGSPDRRDVLRRQGGGDRLPGRRAEPRPRIHVHHDEPCPAECRPRGRGRSRRPPTNRRSPTPAAGCRASRSAVPSAPRSSIIRTCGGC